MTEETRRAKALEDTLTWVLNDLQEWCDAVAEDAPWEGWDSHYKSFAYGGIAKARAALDAASRLPAEPKAEVAEKHPYAELRKLADQIEESDRKNHRFRGDEFELRQCKVESRPAVILRLLSELDALESRNAELQRKGEELCHVLGGLGIHIHELGLRSVGEMGQWKFRNERAEKAEREVERLTQELEDMKTANVDVKFREGYCESPAQAMVNGMPNPRVSDNFIQSRIYWGRAEGTGDVGIYEELQAWRAWAAGRVGK